MHTGFIKRLSLLLFVIMIFSLSYSIFNVSATPLDEPLLYYNDNTWSREDRCPLKIIDDTYYVPLVIFAQLDDTKVRTNNSLNTFVISHGEKYISFDASTDIATDESNTYYYIQTYKLDYGERYVPASVVCEYLDYGLESFTNALTGKSAVRITDGSEKFSFEEILKKYNPKILKTEEETTKDTSKTSTEETKKSENTPSTILGSRIIYLTIENGANDYTSSLVDLLGYYGYKATFFIDKSDIEDYPLLISKIISSSHKIGIKPDSDNTSAYTDIDSLIDELDETNELLYRVFKQKTRTVMLDDVAYANTGLMSSIYSGSLTDAGYALWNRSFSAVDGLMANNKASESIINNIWSKNTVVIPFLSNSSTYTVLSDTLNFILKNADKCDVRPAGSAYTPPR